MKLEQLKKLGPDFFWRYPSAITFTSKKLLREIALTPYYVMAQDIALSGWGGATDGKAFIVIPCHEAEIAQMVAAACEAESYLKNVRVYDVLPRLSRKNHYALYNACNGRRFFGVSPEQDTYQKNTALLQEHAVPH